VQFECEFAELHLEIFLEAVNCSHHLTQVASYN
jgi:hypothetical protein